MNLNFDTGEVYLEINGDPEKKIHFNPHDYGFASRFDDAASKIQDMQKRYNQLIKQGEAMKKKGDPNAQKFMVDYLRKSDKEARELVNTVIGYECADLVFDRTHPMTPVGDGSSILINFFKALSDYLQLENATILEKEKGKIEEYKKEYDRFTA